jgi:hypothetical protein
LFLDVLPAVEQLSIAISSLIIRIDDLLILPLKLDSTRLNPAGTGAVPAKKKTVDLAISCADQAPARVPFWV